MPSAPDSSTICAGCRRNSTRPGRFCGNDIGTSRRVDGKWTEPENLGPSVNSSGSEHTSILTPGGFGGEDIDVTTRGADGVWGPLVNGSSDDRCPAWTPDLKIFVFDSVRQGGFGSRDTWWVYFKDVTAYPLAEVSTGATSLALGAQVMNDIVPQVH